MVKNFKNAHNPTFISSLGIRHLHTFEVFNHTIIVILVAAAVYFVALNTAKVVGKLYVHDREKSCTALETQKKSGQVKLAFGKHTEVEI